MDGINKIDLRILAFKRKYYKNLFIKGFILTFSIALAYFLVVVLLEYNFWLTRLSRFTLLILFFAFILACIALFLKAPLLWVSRKRGLSGEESAKIIGKHFPEINDRLLNVLQLSKMSQSSGLVKASIDQKIRVFEKIPFESAIDLRHNRQYFKYLIVPVLLTFSILIYNNSILTQGANRIVHFNKDFTPAAPFQFQLVNSNLNAFLNEDFILKVKLIGDSQPESVYLLTEFNQLKLTKNVEGVFSYVFENVQNDISFALSAAGFKSRDYTLKLVNRPELTNLKLTIRFPGYLKQKDLEIINGGDIEIPEGSFITWKLNTVHTSKATISFLSDGSKNHLQSSDDQLFTFNKSFRNPDRYTLGLENNNSRNKEKINHSISIVKDQYPEITLGVSPDSLLFKYIFLNGQLRDDYGITKLLLHFEFAHNNRINRGTRQISTSHAALSTFLFNWNLDSINLAPSDKLTYFLEVWDNDGVNGNKSTKSSIHTFSIPSKPELKSQIAQSQLETETKINESIAKAEELNKSLKDAQQKLKGKQKVEWQDKKKLEEIIQNKQELDKAITELQKQNELLEQRKQTFTEENEKIKEKSEQIQKLMDELMDDETKKLFEELQKLVKENAEPSQLQKMLDKIDKNEINLEKELERTLELFKELQFDYKVDQAINQLKDQINKQENILKETNQLEKQKGNDNSKRDSLADEQEKLNQNLDELKKTSDEIEKLSNELEKQIDAPSKEDLNKVDEDQENSKNQLKQGQPKKASESQKKAIDKMSQMKNSLESSQNSMEMEINMQNLEALRQATHGLIKLSYDQEQTLKEFAGIQQSDPKYLSLSQNQLKIKDDARVLEDSLLAISKRDPLMGNFVIKEIGDLNEHFEKASENIKERKKQNASTEMQLSMTSINNLALMLDDHYNSLMEMMAKARPGKGKQGIKPSLSQLQKKINDKINELKKNGKGDRTFSEEFARMAAEQERIRRALEEMENKIKKQGGNMPGGNISEEMEKTELDLVNKQITEKTIKRQQEIIARLLEAEKSMREQNQDEERKGESARGYSKEVPRAFKEYLKIKEKEVELLKTVPPKLYPYYKKEVNDYFKRIETEKTTK